jgi:hypothetical protein
MKTKGQFRLINPNHCTVVVGLFKVAELSLQMEGTSVSVLGFIVNANEPIAASVTSFDVCGFHFQTQDTIMMIPSVLDLSPFKVATPPNFSQYSWI